MKKKTTGKSQRRFTLIELLVSLGVLVIILGFVLQLFVGTQKIWTSLSQRNDIYADARVAMDIMTTMLQSSFYSDGGIPFCIDQSAGATKSKIYFATQTKENLPGDGALKYVSFQWYSPTNSENQLRIAVFCDKDSDFYKYFPPYRDATISSFSVASSDTGIIKKLNDNLADASYGSVLIPRVIGFSVIPYDIYSSGAGIIENNTFPYRKFPYMVVLKVTVLSPDDYKIWMRMAGTYSDNGTDFSAISDSDNIRVKFRKGHEYTFTRGVYLGERPRLNIND